MSQALDSTKRWIEEVVIAHQFCPFAARPFIENKILFKLIAKSKIDSLLVVLEEICVLLDGDSNWETAIVIYEDDEQDFQSYLTHLRKAESYLLANDYEGIYQLASFHPKYLFAGSVEDDASNYTNRSPYPLFHLLREDSLEKAIASHPDVESIPQRNIAYSTNKGLKWWQDQLKSVLKS